MPKRTLVNPDTLASTLYLPDGTAHITAYTPTAEDYNYMDLALEQAAIARDSGNVAIGAVFVTSLSGDVFPAHSTEIQDDDLDAHAEANAYKQCKGILGRDLSTVTAYVTTEPCDSCAHRFMQGRIGKLVYGADYSDAPEYFRPRNKGEGIDEKFKRANRTLFVVKGLKKIEALALLTDKFH